MSCCWRQNVFLSLVSLSSDDGGTGWRKWDEKCEKTGKLSSSLVARRLHTQCDTISDLRIFSFLSRLKVEETWKLDDSDDENTHKKKANKITLQSSSGNLFLIINSDDSIILCWNENKIFVVKTFQFYYVCSRMLIATTNEEKYIKKSIWWNWKLLRAQIRAFLSHNECWMEDGKCCELSQIQSGWNVGVVEESKNWGIISFICIILMTYFILLTKIGNFENPDHLMDCVKNCRLCNKCWKIFDGKLDSAYLPFFTVKTRHNSLSLRLIEEGSKFQVSPEPARMKWDGISHQSKFWQAVWRELRWQAGELKSIFIYFLPPKNACGVSEENWRWFSSNKIIKFSNGKRSQLMWQIAPSWRRFELSSHLQRSSKSISVSWLTTQLHEQRISNDWWMSSQEKLFFVLSIGFVFIFFSSILFMFIDVDMSMMEIGNVSCLLVVTHSPKNPNIDWIIKFSATNTWR